MKAGPRVFVFLVFLALGLSFVATTAALAMDFWRDDLWLAFLTSDSHLFLFFPTFAIVALVAFYLPSCAIVDLYWNHLRLGRIRFALGLLVLGAAAWALSALILSGQNKSIWTINPEVLYADSGEPAGCLNSSTDCARLPVVQVVKNLRDVSQSRQGLRPLVRNCQTDPLIERASQVGPNSAIRSLAAKRSWPPKINYGDSIGKWTTGRRTEIKDLFSAEPDDGGESFLRFSGAHQNRRS
jgi:hypothetical protein